VASAIAGGELFVLSPTIKLNRGNQMGLMKKLFWDTSPAVIIAKKTKEAQKNKRAAQTGLTRADLDAKEAETQAAKQAVKKRKKLSISGAYYGSHPSIRGQDFLSIEFGDDSVYIVARKDTVKTFNWNEIISFDKKIEDKSQVSTNQRVTATRMAAIGVFALAAPKKTKSGNVRSDFVYVLRTTTGDIEIERTIDSGDAPIIGDANRNWTKVYVNQQTAKANNIKRLVAERATGKPTPINQNQSSSVADELERFAELKEKGVITQAEFDAKKKDVLNS
jgi:hypothetical protein